MKRVSIPLIFVALALAACTASNPGGTATSTVAPSATSAPATATSEPSTSTPAVTEVASATDTTTAATVAPDTTAVPEATAATVTAPISDTVLMSDTSPMTNTMAMTGTAPMTDTMVMTDTATVTSTLPMSDTSPMTNTMAMTDTAPMTSTMPMTSAMASEEKPITATSAMAELQDAKGKIVGMALFTDTAEGVQIGVEISGFVAAKAGEHGIHIHQVGACTPDFAAAGGHFNPTMHKHGSKNPDGPHVGDLKNIIFDDAGNASYSTTNSLFMVSGTMTNSLLAADGSAIVIHADPDDNETDPSGRSGGRILCGVLMAAGVDAPAMSAGAPPPPGGTLNEPKTRIATPELIAGLQVPAGFTITVFAKGLDNVRVMAQHGDVIYVTRRAQGDVIALRDDNGDGKAEPFVVAASKLPLVQGIIITGDQVYLGTPTTIYRGTIQADGTFGELTEFVTGLPEVAQHINSMIAFGPDGSLYVTIGSSCNSCNESNPEHAAMLKIAPDGKSRTIFAKGLRNTLGWGWQPETGELWGMDHGSDWRGDDQPPEELNRIEEGNNYGWPYCYGNKQVDRYLAVPPSGMTKAEFCAASTAPVMTYQAHSAPIGMVFYTGTQFPADYRNGAFVAMRGSWNRAEPTGYKVVHVHFINGQPVEFRDFLTGFLIENQTAVLGRPAGLLVLSDGSLLVADDTNGMIYQIAYKGS